MKKLLRFIIWLAVVLVIIIIVKTLLFKSLQQDFNSPEPIVFGDESVSRLTGAVKFPTVSYEFDSPVDTAAFLGYMEFLKNEYPLVHSRLKREVINQLSMLYTWEGSNRSAGAMVLMAHYDVVPPGDTALWEKGPFSGYNDGTYIWGRGTLDDKVAMISILEAVEKLLSEGFVPERTVYLSFGHDEEISGVRGAATIAATLRERGVKVEYVLDEGMAVTKGMVPLIKKPVALIGTSEKGYISVKLSCGMPGGHSSTPEKESALTLIAGAVDRLNKNQMKPHFSGPVNDFIRYVGPEMPFYGKVIFANKWLFRRLLLGIYTGSASGNALVRTTTAPTIISSGVKDNVIPVTAGAVVNFRILPGQNSADVLDHVKKTVNDERIIIEPAGGFINEPAPFSQSNTMGFRAIFKTIREIYPEAVVAPTLTLSASDSRHFSQVTNNIYRFAPLMMTSEDMARVHGLNERTMITDYLHGISFYYRLLKNSQ